LAWSRRPAFLPTALLAGSAYLSFHSQRDRWFLMAVACAILAGAFPGDETMRQPLPAFAKPMVSLGAAALLWLGVAALLWAGISIFGVDNQKLNAAVAANFPADAVDAIRKQGLKGPVFNDFGWGGYLIWALPDDPVVIDGRTTVHGWERIARNENTWTGKPGWEHDPDLEASGLIIAPVNIPLAELMRMDPQFHLVYQDKLAAVFVHKPRF
jgi:hypothetical protein